MRIEECADRYRSDEAIESVMREVRAIEARQRVHGRQPAPRRPAPPTHQQQRTRNEAARIVRELADENRRAVLQGEQTRQRIEAAIAHVRSDKAMERVMDRERNRRFESECRHAGLRPDGRRMTDADRIAALRQVRRHTGRRR